MIPPVDPSSPAPTPRHVATATVLPEEMEKFAAMADSWWDPAGKFRPLHIFNPTRIAFIRDAALARFQRSQTADKPFAGLSLLDVGCGGGLLCEPMARLGFSVLGIDALERNVDAARSHARQSGLPIDYRCASAEVLAAEGRQADVVLVMEIIEHVGNPLLFLKTAASLVRPGGLIVGSTINRTFKALLFAKLGAEYVLRWLPRGTHDWKKFVKPSEFIAGLEQGGIRVEALKGMTYAPLSDAWSLNDDLAVNYLLAGVKTA